MFEPEYTDLEIVEIQVASQREQSTSIPPVMYSQGTRSRPGSGRIVNVYS